MQSNTSLFFAAYSSTSREFFWFFEETRFSSKFSARNCHLRTDDNPGARFFRYIVGTFIITYFIITLRYSRRGKEQWLDNALRKNMPLHIILKKYYDRKIRRAYVIFVYLVIACP